MSATTATTTTTTTTTVEGVVMLLKEDGYETMRCFFLMSWWKILVLA